MPGGGSKPGERRGGRKKGTPNKRTVKTQETVDKFLEGIGNRPLEAMQEIAEKAIEIGDLSLALNAYKELAQYVAPKRKAIEHSQDPENPLIQAEEIRLTSKK